MNAGVNGTTIMNTLRMLRQVDSRVFILLEGDEDLHVLEHFLDDKEVLAYPTRGKVNALDAGRTIDAESLLGMVVVVDRDYDGYTGQDQSWPACVIATERYDFLSDLMSIAPGVVERVARAHCNPGLYRKYVEPGRNTIETTARSLLEPLTILGITSHVHVLGVRTTSGDKRGLLEADEKNCLRAHCLETVASAAAMKTDDLEALMKEVEVGIDDPALYVNGHDLVSTVATIVVAKCGGRTSGRALEAALFGAFQWIHLESTRVHQKLSDYATSVGRQIWVAA